jgi:hypothetical protein
VNWLNNNSDDTLGDVTYKTDRAAYLCEALVYGGYSDWFLPSKDELNLMYENLYLKGFGGFADCSDCYYWSSSEVWASGAQQWSSTNAWIQWFISGGQFSLRRSNALRVRAVRAF